jgi:hypothetical protein
MKDQRTMERFVAELDGSSDLMALANACAGLAWHALGEHLRREGEDNHAAAYREVAAYLDRTAMLHSIWLEIEGRT